VSFVLDVSIAAQWHLDDERTLSSDLLLDRVRTDGAHVPALFRWEMLNVLLMAERVSRIESDDLDDALQSLRDLPLRVEPAGERVFSGSEVPLARRYAIRAYDAAYLSLATSLRVPLATSDDALAYAARDLGIVVL
jgi:predicted nucleic acid-binding protein